ncbi:MAG TPA: hypothetical protein VFZ25_12255 [Chloroflexota bacterium]|nr:hypothetical protein [Chloroflexota bacterium]
MCDGYREEMRWTVQLRATGEPLTSAEGFTYLFEDEDTAVAFIAARSDQSALEIVPVAEETI